MPPEETYLAVPASSSLEAESPEQEKFIKKMVWETVPPDDQNDSVSRRWREFFTDETIPPHIQAVAALTTEQIQQAAKGIEDSFLYYAMHTRTPYAGNLTLYGVVLHEDKVDLMFSSLEGYGNMSLTAASVPVQHLDQMTGTIAGEVLHDRSDIIKGLLSEENQDIRNQAKLSFMRYAAEKRPDSVKVMGELGGMLPTGVAYTADGTSMASKMYLRDIPDTDPLLGEAIDVIKEFDVYEKLITHMEIGEMNDMTVKKIEQYMKDLPSWAQQILLRNTPHANYGMKANKIMRLLQTLGYQGNEEQKKWNKTSKLYSIFGDFRNQLVQKALDTITVSGSNVRELLSDEKVDELFRERYNLQSRRKCPEDFSITRSIRE